MTDAQHAIFTGPILAVYQTPFVDHGWVKLERRTRGAGLHHDVSVESVAFESASESAP